MSSGPLSNSFDGSKPEAAGLLDRDAITKHFKLSHSSNRESPGSTQVPNHPNSTKAQV